MNHCLTRINYIRRIKRHQNGDIRQQCFENGGLSYEH